MNPTIKKEFEIRLEKLKKLKEQGIQAYPDSFTRSHTVETSLKTETGTKNVTLAGRILTKRIMGRISFCHIQDDSGKMQIVVQSENIGERWYAIFKELIDTGDFIGVSGEIFKTKKGEISLLIKKLTFLGKALRPLPEKWHGLKDVEQRYRKRYVDLIVNPEVRDAFVKRAKIISTIREVLDKKGFLEVETPIIQTIYGGANAKPFKTHINTVKMDAYLRIATELHLKRLIVGGFEKV